MQPTPVLNSCIQVVTMTGCVQAEGRFTLPQHPGWLVRLVLESDGTSVAVIGAHVEIDPDAAEGRRSLTGKVLSSVPLGAMSRIIRDTVKEVAVDDAGTRAEGVRLTGQSAPDWWRDSEPVPSPVWSGPILGDARTGRKGDPDVDLVQFAMGHIRGLALGKTRSELAADAGYSEGGYKGRIARCKERGLLEGSARSGGDPPRLTKRALELCGGQAAPA